MMQAEKMIRALIEHDADAALTVIHNAFCHCEYIEEGALGKLLDAILAAKSR